MILLLNQRKNVVGENNKPPQASYLSNLAVIFSEPFLEDFLVYEIKKYIRKRI